MANKHSVVVVDVRDTAKVSQGHIADAVAYTPSELSKAKAKFPKAKGAPIVIVSDSDQEARSAFATVRKWGYKNATVLEGGINSWTMAGNKLVSGSAGQKIVYVPVPVPGAIEIARFKSMITSPPSNALILDVRDDSEVKTGMIKGALHIPTQDVASRLAEIPKDKLIIAHCKSGVRASMAYQTLKDNGYNAMFLDAGIDIDPSGKVKIKPKF